MVFQHPSAQKLSGCHVTFELTLGCTQSPEPHFATDFRGTSRRGSSLRSPRSPGRTRPPQRTTHGGKAESQAQLLISRGCWETLDRLLLTGSEHTHPAGRGSGAFAGSPGSAAFSFLRLVSFLLQITVPNALHFLESLCMSWFLFQQSTDAKTESRRADEKQNDTTTAPPITSSHPPQRFL